MGNYQQWNIKLDEQLKSINSNIKTILKKTKTYIIK